MASAFQSLLLSLSFIRAEYPGEAWELKTLCRCLVVLSLLYIFVCLIIALNPETRSKKPKGGQLLMK